MMNRRNFLKLAGIGSAGLGLGGTLAAAETSDAGASSVSSPKIRSYRPLGSTGIKVSDIGFGAINLFNPNVLRYAYECGVNHFDTAEGYLNTNSERYLGQALKDVRGNVIVTTKHLLRSPADMKRDALVGRVEESLKRLQTDYLDVALVHAVDEPEKLDNEEVIAAYTKLKKDGKARFIGFSTHAPQKMLPKAMATGIWEVVLLVYNHMEGPAVEPLVAQARQKGVGLIAMKVIAGGMQGSLKSLVNDKVRYSQAAMRWVLGNPAIDALIATMSTFSHVDEYVAASGMPLQRTDLPILSRYRREAGPLYCRVSCRECLSACPYGVAVNNVLRYAMYFEHYGMERHALRQYGELAAGQQAERCGDCAGHCRNSCPFGLKIQERLTISHRLLTV